MNACRCQFVALLICVLAMPVAASAMEEAGARPRIGLVLSGGGARGLAHVGVLKVLEEMRIPVDAVAGTSMGAVIGGLYASGMSAAEIEALVQTLDWRSSFQDSPPREDLDYRRKQEERDFLVRLPVGFGRDGFKLPRGLIQGQKLTQVLRRQTLPVAEIDDFDRLPIPFRAVATDIETGELVVLGQGDLTSAVRASMSAPGVFAPVELGGRLLVDGGVVNNFPVDVAKAMGVDVVIAVDVSFPPQKREDLDSAFALSNQMLAVMFKRETDRQRALLADRDVLIEPSLGTWSSIDFSRPERLIRHGEQATRKQLGRLTPWALGEAAWGRYVASRAGRQQTEPTVQFVRADEASQQYEARIEVAFSPLIGRPLTARRAAQGVAHLYGDGNFETVDYRIVRKGEARGLEVSSHPRSWGPNYLRFGLELQDDFEGGNNFNAGVRLLLTEVNRFGAEWQTDLQMGEEPTAFTEFYQPLGIASSWFVAPRLRLERRSFDVIEDEDRIAEYLVRSNEVGLDVGRELGNWGEFRVGVLRATGGSELRTGEAGPELPRRTDFERGEVYAGLGLDRLDSVYFPGQGDLFTLDWHGGRTSLGADYDSDRMTAEWMLARSSGRSSYVAWLTGGSILSGPQDVPQDYYTVGGLFNLSGKMAESLSGPHFAIARGIYFRRIGRGGPGFFDVPTYAGLSLEFGNVWQRRGDIDFATVRTNGALFLGFDTPVGPVYFAVGFDEGGGNALYLQLGRIR